MTGRKHFLILTLPLNTAWGHVRGQLHLSFSLLLTHTTSTITLLLPDLYKSKCEPEISRYHLGMEDESRINIQYVSGEESPEAPNETGKDDGSIIRVCGGWCGDMVKPVLRRVVEEAGQEVDVVIADYLLLAGLRGFIDDLFAGKKMPKVLKWIPMGVHWFPCVGIQDSSQPFSRALGEYHREVESGVSEVEAFEKAIGQNHDLFNGANLGPMHMWEMDTGPASRVKYHMKTYSVLQEDSKRDDGIVCHWPGVLAPGQTIGSTPLFSIGPQLGPISDKSPKPNDITTFLNSREPASVIYICFGTTFFPPTPSQATILFDTLERSGLGILLVWKAPEGESEMKRIVIDRIGRLQDAGRGMISDWAEQWDVLGHKAVGWFLSHGGSNSAIEALCRGVPMIIWPGAWDQPFIAAHLSYLGLAIELLQVRSLGHGMTTARGVRIEGTDEAVRKEFEGVFDGLKGEKGRDMRKKAADWKEKVEKDMQEGEAKKAMQRLGRL